MREKSILNNLKLNLRVNLIGHNLELNSRGKRVLEKAVRDIAERQARVGEMRVKRERQVEAERQATKEAAAWMEA